jgi:undecaprenyl-diphosphatase
VCRVDLSLYEHLNGFADRHHAAEEVLRFFATDGQLLFLAVLAGLFLARGKWRSQNARHGVVAAGFSALLALGVAQVIGDLWDRARPYEAHPGDAHLLLTPSPDPSFPSDHATAAFAIAVAIGLRHRKAGILTFVLAALVSIGRVALGTHYPSDVLGGALLGAAAALLLWWPPVRRPLHRLADAVSALYEALAAGLARRLRSSAPA